MVNNGGILKCDATDASELLAAVCANRWKHYDELRHVTEKAYHNHSTTCQLGYMCILDRLVGSKSAGISSVIFLFWTKMISSR